MKWIYGQSQNKAPKQNAHKRGDNCYTPSNNKKKEEHLMVISYMELLSDVCIVLFDLIGDLYKSKVINMSKINVLIKIHCKIQTLVYDVQICFSELFMFTSV